MNIETVAIIGAGVMGAAIAAQVANAGVPALLLDLVPAGAADRNLVAANALHRLAETHPPAFMHERNVRLISPGNIEDHGHRLAEADWIVEAVVERLDVKQQVYRLVDAARKPGAVVSSNTSTLPLAGLVRGFPERFRRDFLITHFFNPPRYTRLVELVAGAETRPEAMATLSEFLDRRLGKNPVPCKDTPGFIANRIGVYWLQLGLLEALRLGLTVEEADAAVGRPFGIPRSGVFGLLDLVGLDLIPHVVESLDRELPNDDPFHAISQVPDLVGRLVAEGHTGRKGKGGFYRLGETKVREALDLAGGFYRAVAKPEFQGPARPREAGWSALWDSLDRSGEYARSVMAQTLGYAATVAGQIADDLETIDRALRLGYNWQWGPFELIDRIGAERLAATLAALGKPVPELLRRGEALYRIEAGELQGLAFTGPDGGTAWRTVRPPPGVLRLADLKRRGPPLEHNVSASLWDLGEGVACLEFHSKLNTFDAPVLELVRRSVEIVGEAHRALLIYNEAEHFSAGANLGLLLFAANIGLWDEVEKLVKSGQDAFSALKYAPFPVVGAPAGLALGGGAEILLHCDAIEAHAELYMGLVETGVGLVPAWGGCKEMLLRAHGDAGRPRGPVAPLAGLFELIGTATVSQSAQQARDLGFLRPGDGIVMNRDRLLYAARERALMLAEDYHPPQPPTLALPGLGGKAALDIAIGQYRRLGKLTEYDAVVADALAEVLSGGEADLSSPLSEADVLALERRAFLALIRREKTLARVEYRLETGKPLRN